MYVAGHYNLFYSPLSNNGDADSSFTNIGATRNGYSITYSYHKQPIINDAFGDAESNAIQQGVDAMIRFEYIEYDRIVQAMGIQMNNTGGYPSAAQAAYAYYATGSASNTYGTGGFMNTNVGLTFDALCGQLVAVPVIGSPAYAQSAGTARFYDCAIVDSDHEVMFSSKLRQAPVTFKLLPNQSGNFERLGTIPSGATNAVYIPTGATSVTPLYTGF